MADLATLALVVDASGAQQSIRLTTEQLKTLANGGKEAQAVLRSLGGAQVVQPMNTVTVAAAGATQGITHLRGALTVLASQAVGMPGPLGRVAATLGMMGLGSPVMVGALAGIAALGLAWTKFREEANKAAAAMKELHKLESSFGPSAMQARSGSLHQQEARLAGQLEAQQSLMGAVLPGTVMGVVLDYVNMFKSSETKAQLSDVRDRLKELNDAIAHFTRTLQGEASDARRFMTQTVAVAGWENAAGRVKARQWWNPNAGVDETAFATQQKAELTYSIEAAKAQREYAGDALKAKLDILNTERLSAIALAQNNALNQKGLTIDQQKASVQQHLANFALGAVAQGAGPFGGMVSGIAGGLMSGNPWLAAAAGVTGLVDGLFGLGRAARASAEAARQAALAYQDFLVQQNLVLGDITKQQADAYEIHRQFDAARAPFEKRLAEAEAERRAFMGRHPGQRHGVIDEDIARQQAEIAKLNELERRRIEGLGKEADALDRVNSILNAPSGFFVNQYLRRLGADTGWESPSGVTPRTLPVGGGGRTNSTGTTYDLRGATFTLDGFTGPEVFQSFVTVLRQKARSTGGAAMPLSDALNVS